VDLLFTYLRQRNPVKSASAVLTQKHAVPDARAVREIADVRTSKRKTNNTYRRFVEMRSVFFENGKLLTTAKQYAILKQKGFTPENIGGSNQEPTEDNAETPGVS